MPDTISAPEARKKTPYFAQEAARLSQYTNPGKAAAAKAIFNYCAEDWPKDRDTQEGALMLLILSLYIGGYVEGVRHERRRRKQAGGCR